MSTLDRIAQLTNENALLRSQLHDAQEQAKRVRGCGKATGLPDGSIWNILEKAGHKPGGRVPIRKCAIIKQLLAEGASVKDAAAQTQTSVDYARQCRREMGASK